MIEHHLSTLFPALQWLDMLMICQPSIMDVNKNSLETGEYDGLLCLGQDEFVFVFYFCIFIFV